MNTPPKQWPDNVTQFRIAGLAMGAFDQEIMVSLRQLADRTGETVEEHINRAVAQFVKRCEADGELATKVIPFPKQVDAHEVSPRKHRPAVHRRMVGNLPRQARWRVAQN
jgi:hypothetical protein